MQAFIGRLLFAMIFIMSGLQQCAPAGGPARRSQLPKHTCLTQPLACPARSTALTATAFRRYATCARAECAGLAGGHAAGSALCVHPQALLEVL